MLYLIVLGIIVLMLHIRYEFEFDIIYIDGKKHLIVWYWTSSVPSKMYRDYKILM